MKGGENMAKQLSAELGAKIVERGYERLLRPQMRTLDTGIKEIKEIDPHTQITKNALRNALLSGVIPSKQIGAKRIFDLNKAWEYFGSSSPAPDSATLAIGLRDLS